MRRLPIRLRLTLAFTLAMAVLLGGLGLVVYDRVEDSLNDNVDQALRSRATDIAAVVRRSGPKLPEGEAGQFVEREESFTQLLDSTGRVVDGSARAEARPLLDGADLERARAGSLTVARDDAVEVGDPARLFAVPVDDLTLVVGQATDDNEESLAALRVLLLAGLPAALILASIAGYAVAAGALRPVEAMRRKAASVSDESFGERLPVPATDDEIGRLGQTLNAMLTRLEGAIERERGFVADASHELRTPLAVLKTELELALREGRSAHELRAALTSAAEETDRLVRLADDLLVLARSDRGALPLRRERLDLRSLLDGIAERFRLPAGSVRVPDGLAVHADGLRLQQALGNLVANALAHGDGGVRLSARREGESVEVHVEDDGPGLPADFVPRAFDRFTRADGARTGGGAGLGLAIVDAIARAHGGRSGVGARASGADVWIALPALIDASSKMPTTHP